MTELGPTTTFHGPDVGEKTDNVWLISVAKS